MNVIEVVMNPVRQRIIQFLMIHEKGTVKEMKNNLSDVPTPSLYRHVKILAEDSGIHNEYLYFDCRIFCRR